MDFEFIGSIGFIGLIGLIGLRVFLGLGFKEAGLEGFGWLKASSRPQAQRS